jgi:Leucine-rich repeat (LRR) protein
MSKKSLIFFVIFCMAVVFGAASDLPEKAGTADEPTLSKTMDNCPTSSIPSTERQALIDLYNSTNGDSWTNNTNWRKPGDPTQFNDPGTECSWYGVECNSTCTHVIAIELPSNNLNGPLPDLSALTELQTIYFFNNSIYGNIPSSLNSMTQLKTIHLGHNNLTGNIPSLSNLSQLQELTLYYNNLSGGVPSYLNTLGSLKRIYLNENQLTGSIPNLSSLFQLEMLYLGGNQLTGGIPTWLNQLTTLVGLGLGPNPLGGTIPDLSNLTNLAYFHLPGCQLSGSFPTWINNLTKLQTIYFYSNNLSGPAPDLGNLTQLKQLQIYNNSLTGEVPNLSNAGALQYYLVNDNQFSGSFPTWLCNAVNLYYLNMEDNNLSGTIPDLSNLTNLVYLYLKDNEFSGSIPNLYGLTKLKILWLSNNRFSGNLPGEISTLTSLDYLYLEGNMLKGSIPSSLTNLTNLIPNYSKISWNGLYTDDPALIAFLDSRMPNWENTQTIPPENLSVSDITDDSLVLHWDPIFYQGNTGGYKIYYTSDSMGTFYLLETINDKSEDSYSVPSILNPGTTYTFAIKAFTEPHINNKNEVISDYSSTVSATTTGGATITVTSPNGGETWAVGSVQTITWTNTGSIGDVNIHYTDDNGISWHPVAYSTANDGSYDWTVPEPPSNWCRVKISEAGGSASDESDGMFSIIPAATITVTSPNGGENWAPGSAHNITWTSTGSIANVDIALSTDGGATWTTLFAGTANDGSESITLPSADSTNCLIRVSETGGTTSDVSDAVFTISTPHSITITSPNGGESWAVGSTQTITWNSTGNLGDLRIRYSVDNGVTWITIAEISTNPGSYTWVVPDAPSETCLVRIREIGQYVVDNSDAVFTIYTPHSITITSPNGGENWTAGTTRTITWNSTGNLGDLRIRYSTDNGVTWTTIAVVSNNPGSYSWVVPNTPSTTCLVRIREIGQYVVDNSDAVFTISEPQTITLLTPNGGEVWPGGAVKVISWTFTGTFTIVDLSYSLDNGATWTDIAVGAYNSGRYIWNVPRLEQTVNTCLVKVAIPFQNIYDTSDGTFTISTL